MKLAFFVSDYPVTSETFIVRQIAGMVSLGHEVTVIAGHFNKEIKDPLRGKIKVIAIRNSLSAKDHVSIVRRFLTFDRYIPYKALFRTATNAAKNKVRGPLLDIYHVGTRGLGSYDAILAHFGPAGVRAMLLRDAGLLSGPIATVFHGMDMTDTQILQKYRSLYRDLFDKTEFLLPISDLWKKKLIEWGAKPEKIKVHRMGVDIDSGHQVRHLTRQRAEYLEILSVGRFVEKKGLEYAIAGVVQSEVKCRYTIVGYGPLEKKLREAAAGNDSIHFAGKVDHAGVFRLLFNSDVFLLPSVTASNGDMEGIPVSIMEAMAANVLVLATDHSGIPELVEDGVDGILVTERDAGQIAQALQKIASGQMNVSVMKRMARAKVEGKFNNEILDRQLSGLLQNIGK